MWVVFVLVCFWFSFNSWFVRFDLCLDCLVFGLGGLFVLLEICLFGWWLLCWIWCCLCVFGLFGWMIWVLGLLVDNLVCLLLIVSLLGIGVCGVGCLLFYLWFVLSCDCLLVISRLFGCGLVGFFCVCIWLLLCCLLFPLFGLFTVV